ncbi:MAG: UDP-3-O-acyl-N-acetylglucosamine deacetylase [Myxococcota bacterium]|nr:UDP-3-O-acyl-N-acetylglucosamine deacetylase [Myxococcota bacterium]
MAVEPAAPGSGVIFRVKTSAGWQDIPAHWRHISSTRFAMALEYRGARISTIEHFLAACAGMGLDNALVTVNGPELPILDGSSSVFARAIREAGLAEQDQERRLVIIRRPISAQIQDARIRVSPADKTLWHGRVQFNHPWVGRSYAWYDPSAGRFLSELAPARTFGFTSDLDAMRAAGLIRGGSLDNALVIGDHGPINEDGARFFNECARHKILDAMGDLFLLGGALVGEIELEANGHTLHAAFMRKLWETPGAADWYPTHSWVAHPSDEMLPSDGFSARSAA